MPTEHMTPMETTGLGADVESLLDTGEPEAQFRDSRECAGAALLLGLLLLSPPTPRPQPQQR